MKDLAMLKASASMQAHRMHLRIYAKIEISERGKVRTLNVFTHYVVTAKQHMLKLFLSD